MSERRRITAAGGPTVIGPDAGVTLDLGGSGVRYLLWGEESGGGFSLVEHPIPPRHMAAPVHRHSLEDEYSYVLEGRLGALLGDDVVYAGAGDLVCKPREQWHTFWNAGGDGPCRVLEIISPAGFEQFFADLVDPSSPPEEFGDRYWTETDDDRTARLCEEHGLVLPPPPTGAARPAGR